MIEYKEGNLLEAEVEALVNTVNCVGVMWKGIALQFKQAFPTNFKEYEKACRSKKIVPGKMFTVSTGSIFNPKWIINFRPLIESAFLNLSDIMVWIYPPIGSPKPDEIKIGTSRPKMTRARALFVLLMDNYAVPGYRLSLLKIQKLESHFIRGYGDPLPST